MTPPSASSAKLYERESVIIFDEIQKSPETRQAIKYLVKDHRYDYIETGSLLSIKKNTRNIVITSEETRLTMYPMDYEEFRWALGDTVTVPLLGKSSGYNTHKSLDEFCKKYSNRVSDLFLIYTKDLRCDGQISPLLLSGRAPQTRPGGSGRR